MPPVAVPFIVTVPVPLASIDKLLFAPLSVQVTAVVPPVMPALMFMPVTHEAVELSKFSVGLVAP